MPGEYLTGADRERYYVIAGGFFSGRKNQAAQNIRDGLVAQGIPDNRIITLSSCYDNHHDDNPAPPPERHGWWGRLRGLANDGITVVRNLWTYLDVIDPQSRTTGRMYSQMQERLNEASGGQPVDVTVIGYSGGGQLGLSLAS